MHVVHQRTELDLGHILQMKGLTGRLTCQNDVLIFDRLRQTSFVAQRILVRHVGVLTKLTRGSLNVLSGKGSGNIRRDESVLLHLVRLEPDTHRIAGSRRRADITHTVDTLEQRHDVDVVVVGHELVVVTSVVRGEGIHHHVRGLTLRHCDTYLGDLSREQCLSLRHTVLHVHGSHIRIGALLEVDRDHGHTIVSSRRGHVSHVLHTVDTLLQGDHNRFHHRLGISTRIGR